MTDLIKLRRDTTSAWTAADPILAIGEPGFDTTLARLKIGDGATAWTSLDFVDDRTGGGGGSAPVDVLSSPIAGQTTIDEFNDATLDAAWTQVDGTNATSGNIVWTEAGDALSGYNAGADGAAFHGMVRPLTGAGGSVAAGDAFVTCMTLLAAIANDTVAGLVLSTNATHGAGQQITGQVNLNSSGYVVKLYDIASWGGIATFAGAYSPPIMRLHMRLVYLGSDVWRCDLSPDGISWIKGPGTLSKAMVPTHVGFCCSSYTSANKHVASFEYLRRVAGVS